MASDAGMGRVFDGINGIYGMKAGNVLNGINMIRRIGVGDDAGRNSYRSFWCFAAGGAKPKA